MKLRIKGNSLRLRITPSEMTRLLETGRIDETIHFTPDQSAYLTYALEHGRNASAIAVRYSLREVAVVLSSEEAHRWADAGDVGLYAQMPTAHGPLELAVEKDFACLDKTEAENVDTFPHPHTDTVC